MSDIRQFRPLLYILVFLGITGYALAAQSETTWVVGTTAILLNAWLVASGRFRPVPRLISSAATLIAMVYSLMIYRDGGNVGAAGYSPILVVAQFLVILQIVKLFEQRGNRDYAQLLVLSVLLMVAAAISTAKFEFGALFIVYMFLALYACLLFHLKVETDHAKSAIGVPEEKLNPTTLRQDQRYLPRSMRRLTVFVAIVAIATAIVVFLFFPRNTGAGLLGPMQVRQTQTLSGFSDQMNFQQVAQITQNQTIVGYVKLWDEDNPIEGTRPVLLRGATLDVYTGKTMNWQWQRTISSGSDDVSDQSLDPQHSLGIDGRYGTGALRQEIILEPTGTEALFAMGGVTDLRPLTPMPPETRIHVQRRDQTLRMEPLTDKTFRYEVRSTGSLHATTASLTRPQSRIDMISGEPRLIKSSIDPQIEAYARRIEVSGDDEEGALAPRRPKDQLVTALDERIASNIARHLMGPGFFYTMDLSDAVRVRDRDPIVAFLYDFKRGHCEYFAGAMTLLCQSLGLQARVVVGFSCDEYNAMTQSYVVRQSHAHAWVEVLNDKMEWVTFDPTSGREGPAVAHQSGAWDRAKQFLDYLEYTWANSVVAYDHETRANVIQNVESGLNTSADSGMEKLKNVKRWFDLDSLTDPLTRSIWFAQLSSKIVVGLIVILLLALTAAVSWFLLERWRLRRRAKRIGLAALPQDTQLRLARQLAFYDDLLRLLARHKIVSPAHLTPMEFNRTLAFLPSEVFDTISRMTNIFYRIRFGGTGLSNMQQRRLKASLARIETQIERISV